MTDKILNNLRSYFGLTDQQLTAQTSFRNDLAWDEIDLFEVFFVVEQDYDIEITDEQADQIDNVGQLVEWLQRVIS
ncbi:MAG: acyl carrier protein [Tissierellia bacterium]|nr:acyl carrier protein [Tissierellia bacterium]